MEIRQYDPESLASFCRQRPFALLGRRLRVVQACLNFTLGLGWDWLTRRIEKNQRKRAKFLCNQLIQLGPTFIKFGQILSCRPDLVPPVYLDELTHLQDQLPPFANSVAFELIQSELGHPYLDIYDYLIPSPVAAASLGQVYKGRLKTGEEVAVKVQRPGLFDIISLDIIILRQLSGWLEDSFSFIHSDLRGSVDELATRLFEEMDYTHEGKNAEQFESLYGYLGNIVVPEIYWDYTAQKVLTMEWIDGTKLTNLQAIADQGLDSESLIEIGFECAMRQLLEGGFFHADPHPGNLLATPEGKLAYLDFGMMSNVDPHYRDLLMESVIHILIGDFESLAKDYVKLDFLPENLDTSNLISELEKLFGDVRELSVAEFGYKDIITGLFPLVYEYPFRLPTYYILIFRSFATLEGLAIKVNPEYQAFSSSYPYLAQRLLTQDSPVLRNCLQDLLFKEDKFQWQQLEELVANAQDNTDYNINLILRQGLEFLYSEQGMPLRKNLIREVVNSLEEFNQDFFRNLTALVGINPELNPVALRESPSSLAGIQGLSKLVQNPSSFTIQSLQEFFEILLSQETQQLGQEILQEWSQRTIKRMVTPFLDLA